ncbi:hypothetical protein Pcinc_004711 [Petrolisthes cinctipes]|uniref:PiggyBac transposable element-derived protein domain-containing protein n=1 Tax=Petrolisthes cinctipes TaxID=88211 RepID=A0AAE1L191_PETCI|nr:hypothetical protein Pcinc_004711 [Petrolisthes cinctipes]
MLSVSSKKNVRLSDTNQDMITGVYDNENSARVDSPRTPPQPSGCLSVKQYIPSKRLRFGINIFVLCAIETGYILDYVIYSASDFDVNKSNPLGFSGSVVKVLMNRYLCENHVLYTDNCYTSPALTMYLKDHGVGTVGTVRTYRKHYPQFPASQCGDVGDQVAQQDDHQHTHYRAQGLLAGFWEV